MLIKKTKKLVFLGMSGGVDSSVAAYLLKRQGYEVVGLFMRNWQESSSDGRCSADSDFKDVAKVCSKLDIAYHSIDFSREYYDLVFSDFLKGYERGDTPNPDILCNKEIKFKLFYDKARQLGADYVATGHYCQTSNSKLVKGFDKNKDQTYFLYTIKDKILKNVLFPIGHLDKLSVRKIALEQGLATHNKKDSTGICFIGERKFRVLSRYIETSKGEFRTLDEKVVGSHHGMPFYTVGQRRRLGLGGAGARWFVVKKDPTKNIVYVERGNDHPQLYNDYLFADDISWVAFSPLIFLLYAKLKFVIDKAMFHA